MASVFVGTVGLKIKVLLSIDISAAGAVKIHYVKPDDTEGEWDAVIEDSGNGLISYTTTDAADLDLPGTWKLNGVWDPDGDNIFYGDTACMPVKRLGDCD